MKSPTAQTWVLAFAATISLCAMTCQGADVAHRVDLQARPRMIVITADSQPLATYVYSDPDISRPYFKDLHVPSGIQVTRHHPPREGIDPADHAHYHPGLWLAFGDLSGADSWRNKARVEHVEFVQAPTVSGNRASFTVRNRYLNDGRTVCEEICEYTFLVRPAGYLILWDSAFRSGRSDFWFGDQEEMGLGVRVATPIMVKSKQGGRILDSAGRKNEKGIWGKQAAWCNYSGPMEGIFAGVTIMPDPGNFRPCWWHTRDYGFMAANPFGRAAFRAGPTSKVPVKKGESFRLSYGILLHADASESDVDLQAAYEDYISVLRHMREDTNRGAQR
ncbi:MAG: DUF6807 domain-containing protein [Planctomycetota bacterium]